MRDIKFRAWFKPGKRMVHFDEIEYCDEYNYLAFCLAEKDRDPEGGNFDNLMAKTDDFSELMQYTGLKDKNGKEIYEGDILEYRNEKFDNPLRLGIVVYRHHAFCLEHIKEKDMDFNVLIMENDYVIGNIYENPELLK